MTRRSLQDLKTVERNLDKYLSTHPNIHPKSQVGRLNLYLQGVELTKIAREEGVSKQAVSQSVNNLVDAILKWRRK